MSARPVGCKINDLPLSPRCTNGRKTVLYTSLSLFSGFLSLKEKQSYFLFSRLAGKKKKKKYQPKVHPDGRLVLPVLYVNDNRIYKRAREKREIFHRFSKLVLFCADKIYFSFFPLHRSRRKFVFFSSLPFSSRSIIRFH